jgi:nicotinate-nucleotide--dimethylbenzimidazole phosphoribosyltransferase
MKFDIKEIGVSLEKEIQHKINFKTKPVGSLGILETIGTQISLIQNTLTPTISKPTIVIFAGDHGVVQNHPVSPFPQEVTAQMVLNFLHGGAAINVFSELNEIDLKVVDSGVNFNFDNNPNLIHAKINPSSKDFTKEAAMSIQDCEKALEKGADIVTNIFSRGCNTIGFGEMGIGNTSSASLIMSSFTNTPIGDCTGKGTGHTEEGVKTKIEILKKAQSIHGNTTSPIEILSAFGGYEIAMMAGAFLQAAKLQMTILVDGFITTSALLAASKINKTVLDYCIFSHTSGEKGHEKMLEYINAKPLLNFGLRLGEGTGAALAVPTLKAAVAFINKMASFESAGVAEKNN